MKHLLAALLLLPLFCSGQLPKVAAGKIVRWELGSDKISPRNIDIWLPPDYSSRKKYPVLYMHDGQMLFDSTTTWNKQEWQVDEIVSRLISGKKIREVIIVGVWNNGRYRHQEYYPEKPLGLQDSALSAQLIANELQGKAMADEYLEFIVKTLKPKVDSAFSTRADRSNTFISGSSMGGLISMYAICEYPSVFGGAACLSTHWIGSLQRKDDRLSNAFRDYMKASLPDPRTHKIYFDLGDQALDANYPRWQKVMDEVMKEKGYSDKNWITKFFPGQDHSERAWASRLDQPLVFLLGR